MGLMEGWRWSKAEKRRQELKKIIKVITPATTTAEATAETEGEDEGEGAGVKRPSLVGRRWSAYDWM